MSVKRINGSVNNIGIGSRQYEMRLPTGFRISNAAYSPSAALVLGITAAGDFDTNYPRSLQTHLHRLNDFGACDLATSFYVFDLEPSVHAALAFIHAGGNDSNSLARIWVARQMPVGTSEAEWIGQFCIELELKAGSTIVPAGSRIKPDGVTTAMNWVDTIAAATSSDVTYTPGIEVFGDIENGIAMASFDFVGATKLIVAGAEGAATAASWMMPVLLQC